MTQTSSFEVVGEIVPTALGWSSLIGSRAPHVYLDVGHRDAGPPRMPHDTADHAPIGAHRAPRRVGDPPGLRRGGVPRGRARRGRGRSGARDEVLLVDNGIERAAERRTGWPTAVRVITPGPTPGSPAAAARASPPPPARCSSSSTPTPSSGPAPSGAWSPRWPSPRSGWPAGACVSPTSPTRSTASATRCTTRGSPGPVRAVRTRPCTGRGRTSRWPPGASSRCAARCGTTSTVSTRCTSRTTRTPTSRCAPGSAGGASSTSPTPWRITTTSSAAPR